MQRNGYDMDTMGETVELLQRQPAAARVTFRGRTAWDTGPAGEFTCTEMEQAGSVTPRDFGTSRGDHPPALLGDDTGPTAGEMLLGALGSCIVATFTAHAAAAGIDLDDVEVELAGDLDLHGFFQLDDTRAGFQDIRATLRVQTDADDAALEQVRTLMTKASPVHDSLSRDVAITSSVERVA